MLQPNFFNTYLVFPILNLLILFYKVFLFIRLPGAFGFAIIALTAFVRLLFQPFFKRQMETASKMQELKPHLDKLSVKHKNDKKQLQQEQMKLYQQAGINPASGCLFMIIQIPIFIALYNTLSLFFRNGDLTKVIAEINKVLYAPFLKITTINPWFFGFNLAVAPKQSGLWYYLLIPLVTGLLQYFQAVSMTPSVSQPKPTNKDNNPASAKATVGEGGDFQKAMNTQMKFMFPIMIGWFSYTLPVGLSLYWNIFSLFSIIQGRKIRK